MCSCKFWQNKVIYEDKNKNHQDSKKKKKKRIEGRIKSFPDKKKLKEFIITKPLLYEMLKGLI